MTKSGVASHLWLFAFGSSAWSERGSSSDASVGRCFSRTLSRCFEPELEALLEGCEIRLARAHFRRVAIESSWSPRESTGPVDFFRRFSSSWRASSSSFHLASLPQNNPAACLAECFFPESGVVFAAPERGWLGFCRSLERTGYGLASGYGCDPLYQVCRPSWPNSWEGPGGITLPIAPYRNPTGWEQFGSGGRPDS